MVYDEELAPLRDTLAERTVLTEKVMFGGLGDDLMMRVGKDGQDHNLFRGLGDRGTDAVRDRCEPCGDRRP